MVFTLTIGFGVGLVLGMFIATALWKPMLEEQIEYYKKDSDNWFNSYIKMLGYYNEMTGMWIKEATKNIGK